MINTKHMVFFALSAVISYDASATQINADSFNARIFYQDDLKQLSEYDKVLPLAVKIFQDSYRAHLDDVRLENNSYVLKDENYKYFLTLYDVIPNMFARVVFNINVKGEGKSMAI